ncbi:MAG: hypothetical protein Q9184_004093 [Pyrenodesmia sp. 2 TL-2023]
MVNSDQVKVQIKRGAHISVPKAIPFDGEVAGQIPTGWDARKYGILDDLVEQVDPFTLFTLCCVSRALYSAGVEDSLEILKHIHLSELGNFIGSSFGGMKKTRQMHKDRYLDKEVQGDVIQEGFANSPAAWVNMDLLGAAGPIKTPVGVWATGVESLHSASESILCGKTKMCLVGGTDDFQEEASLGFASMKATVSSKAEMGKGRNPKEMTRPTAESRVGFVESNGFTDGNGFRQQDTNISPLEASLAVWGLTVDDIDIVSMHGTSTKANDKNESEVIHIMLADERPPNTYSPSSPWSDTPDLCMTPFPKDENLFEAASKAWVEQVISTRGKPQASVTVGINVEQSDQFSSDNQIFIERNYTEAEQDLASQSVDPHSAFAGRWSAKEAVFKSLGVLSKGAGAPT